VKTILPPAFALVACLGFFGCEAVRSDFSAGVREKIHGPVFQTHVFAATQREVFDAARASIVDMGYKITRSGAAQGVIEAYNAIATGETLRMTRQLRLQVRISPVAEGCEIAALFTEMLENDFNKGPGRATENAVKNTSLYDVLFGRIAGQLPKPGAP